MLVRNCRLGMSLALCVVAATIAEPAEHLPGDGDPDALTVTLEVVCAFDPRLPVLSNSDLKEVLDETRRVLSSKLGTGLKLAFHDNGTIPLDALFKDRGYRKTRLYRSYAPWKYDMDQGDQMDIFSDSDAKGWMIEFLKQWDIDALKGFFPRQDIKTYDDAHFHLMKTYHGKIKWLKTLRDKNGAPLILEPPAPFQSYVEWMCMMREQDRYDMVITNQLIIFDDLGRPYPHAVTKHAKVGGSSFISPKRKALDGTSVMISILETYGEVDGLSMIGSSVPREGKNKILGGFLMAHELGHAFYLLFEAYDHGEACLMNSAFEEMQDYYQGYRILTRDMSACPKCRPWVAAKGWVVRAHRAFEMKDYLSAGQLYLKGAAATPEHVDGDYNAYMKRLYRRALDAFKGAGDSEGMARAKKLLSNMKRTE